MGEAEDEVLEVIAPSGLRNILPLEGARKMVSQINPKCPICASPPVAKVVDRMVAAGDKDPDVFATVRGLGLDTIRLVAVRRHRMECRLSSPAVASYAATVPAKRDFALMVREPAKVKKKPAVAYAGGWMS